MRRLPLLIFAALLWAIPTPVRSATWVSEEAEWILKAQHSSGAICHYTDCVAVWPYLGNEAARGLAVATVATGNPRYVDAAWKHLYWYASAMDGNGFVTDYRIEDGELVSTGDMDSTDAYAATFLTATLEAWNASRNIVAVRDLGTAIRKAVDAIAATQDSDGLTWTKPSWRVKYLMDQAEVYAGLQAAKRLAIVLGHPFLYVRASDMAAALREGVDDLWNPSTESYDWAVHSNGVRDDTDWTVLYPDSLQQAWAVAYGLAEGSRAMALLNRFGNEHPHWANPAATDRHGRPVGYWPTAAEAHARVAVTQTADYAIASIRQAAVDADRAWPYTPADAGRLIAASEV